jgi:diadenosine tetraphosphate (Ap4A) HIT family hydrolase
VVAATHADGFRIMQNNGEAANQAVAHIHVHVIPNKLEDKGRFMNRLKPNKDEMESVARTIKSEIAKLS